jgi:NADH:ubiquinone oxidoreductase subunit D
MEEMRQSVRILRQVFANLPEGPINVADAKGLLPKKGKSPDEDGGVDPPLHHRHPRH